ncbi:MAG: hypothetical protein JRH20_00240 [Deltaproteobacteria bacterium]|nr:hypothetical protein [Deltaproteobacteria bacterium]
MTEPTLQLSYASREDLAGHLNEQPGVLLLATDETEALAKLPTLALQVTCPEGRVTVEAEVLQALPGLGLVVRLINPPEVEALLKGATPNSPSVPPEIKRHRSSAGGPPAGSSVLSWGIERLQAEWSQLTQAQRIRLARHGDRSSRVLVLRSQDKTLHPFLLKNPKIGADEVATMAQMMNLAPTLLRQIATSPDWVRHTQIARSLVCHPKLPLPVVQKVIPHLPIDEMRRLTKTGKVRAAVKRILMQRITKGR